VIFGEAHLRQILSAYAAYKRMRHRGELSTASAALSLYQFWLGYIINMYGYDFRKGQPTSFIYGIGHCTRISRRRVAPFSPVLHLLGISLEKISRGLAALGEGLDCFAVQHFKRLVLVPQIFGRG